MKWYREFITQTPEEMNGFFAMMTVPPFPEELHLRKMGGIVWCYQGSMEQANAILEPIRAYRRPAFEFFVPMPFPMLQGMFDGIYPTGLQWYWKADFFKELSDAAIEKHLEHAALLPTWQSGMHLYPVNGKVNRVGETETIAVNGRSFTSRKFLLTTGARPVLPRMDGLEQVPFLTDEQIFDVDRLPGRLIVIGAGPIEWKWRRLSCGSDRTSPWLPTGSCQKKTGGG